MTQKEHRRFPEPGEAGSERGLWLLAGETQLSSRDALVAFRKLISADMDWADSRKGRFRRRAAQVRVTALALTGASTVILGIPEIPARSSIALPLVAAVTLLTALDAFYNWRSRWVLMEETQYRLNRLRDKIDFLLVTERLEGIPPEQLKQFFDEQQAIWSDASRRWVEFRRAAQVEGGQSVSQEEHR